MEINVLQNTKTKLKFEIKGEDHTFCNLLRKELWTNKEVVAAGYKIESALISSPIFIIETKGKTPKKVLENTITRLNKQTNSFLNQFKKIL